MALFSEILPGFEPLYGNRELKRYFSGEIASRTLSHAYILEGKKGSGRHTAAFAVAYALARFEGVPASFSARVLSRCSPDVRLFGVPEKKKTVGVDTVRLLKAETLLRPSELPFRVFLVEDADLMTTAAQNAALKLLEEPPAGVHFFLLAESAEALLETVRSRAVTLRMERFSEEGLREYLASGHSSLPDVLPGDPGKISSAIALSGGCVGELLASLTALPSGKGKGSKKETSGKTAARELLTAIGKKDPRAILPAVLSLPGSAGSGREELSAVLSLLEKMIRDLLLLRAGASVPLAVFDSPSDAAQAGRPFSLTELMRLRDTLHDGVKRLSAGEGLTVFKSALADALKRAVTV